MILYSPGFILDSGKAMATPASVSDELGFLAQRSLSTILDCNSSQQRNWIGLADQMGFPYAMVVKIRETRTTDSPTVALLEAWQEKAGEYYCSLV